MSPRFAKIAVTAAALIFSGGFGVWAATAAPASEKPPNITPGNGGGGVLQPQPAPGATTTAPLSNGVAVMNSPSSTFDVGRDPDPSASQVKACGTCGVDGRDVIGENPGAGSGAP
jgi:hypothetical protein